MQKAKCYYNKQNSKWRLITDSGKIITSDKGDEDFAKARCINVCQFGMLLFNGFIYV